MVRLISPPAAFVQFGSTPEVHCIYGEVAYCLPMVYANDVAFQIILQGDTEGETAALVDADVQIGIVTDESDSTFLLQFTNPWERSRVDVDQVLYNWGHGAPGFTAQVPVGGCFMFRIELDGQRWHSNCLQRILPDCFTSVISYSSNDGAAFGFFACGTDIVPEDEDGNPIPEVDCRPTVITFSNIPTLTIPYTAEFLEKYGQIPSVSVWIYDTNGNLTNMGISAQFVNFPPTAIFIDFGGPASGVVRIGQ